MKRNKLLKFNEWTSWRDDLYDEPEKGDPDVQFEDQLKKKEKKKRKEQSNKKHHGIMVGSGWKEKEPTEELTDKYHWTEEDLKDMKLI